MRLIVWVLCSGANSLQTTTLPAKTEAGYARADTGTTETGARATKAATGATRNGAD